MYISDLDIFGFKSFAHKSQFKFSKGITCVVGPNGCGKTNVVDGIRWVLGEQKSSLLRSDKMTDVIFAGSKYKKPLNYAEVSLTVHNDRGVLPVAYTDVMVTRRLFRDGTSEYLLNNTPVRLKDVQDLFTDTGMSSDVYSVIELKMVEDILSDNRDSRKRLFEEASGISKYRSQRKSSVRKLDATREDLNRLEDIIFEIDKKVQALSRQLKRYEKYQEYVDELRDQEILLAQLQFQDLGDEIAPLEERLSTNQIRQTESSQQLSIEEGMLSSYRDDQDSLEAELDKLITVIAARNAEINEKKANNLVWEEKFRNAEQSLLRLDQDKEDAGKRREANERIRDEISATLHDNDPQIAELKEKVQAAENAYTEAEKDFKEISAQGEALEGQLRSERQAIQELEQKKIRHEDSITQLISLQESLQQRLDTMRDRDGQTEKEMADSKALLTQLSKELASMDAILSEKESEKEKLGEDIRIKREGLAKLDSRSDRVQSELTFYKGILESMEGFNPGVRYVLREMKNPGILGSVADLFKVDEAYTHAIEIGLGNAAKFLVSDTRDTALDIIEELKRRQRGRVTIVPLDIAAGKVRRKQSFDYEFDSNFLAYASDVVHADGEASLLTEFFLGDLVIVKSLRAVPDALFKRSPFRFVTPEGDYYEQKGLLRGGSSQKNSQHILGRKEKIESLDGDLKKLKSEGEDLRREIQESSLRYTATIQEIKDIRANKATLETQYHASDKRQSTLDYELRRSNEEKVRSQEDLAGYTLKIDGTRTALEMLLGDLEKARERAAVTLEKFRGFQDENANVLARRDELNAALQAVRIELITREREKETIRFRYNNALETIEDLTKRLEQMDRETAAHHELIESGRAEWQKNADSLQGLEAEFRTKQEERNELQARLAARKQLIAETTLHINEQHKARENVFQTLKDIELKLNDIRQQQKQIREKIYDRYHVDLALRGWTDSEMGKDEIRENLDRLRRKIELIGPINMAVKVEFDEESARLNFLREQQTDLLEAEKSILETLEKLDTEARTQFSDIFNKVRTNFNKTFTLFFPNGEADIRLTGSSDPLDAEIEIYARPKAKDLKTLKALSGGEKALTAISLLFSIYLVKPSPYCILDEVDAPLDDQNIKRFTSALHHFTERTQFIIVTHNKLTMEAADYLYGVTMEEEGVSKIVSVKFSD